MSEHFHPLVYFPETGIQSKSPTWVQELNYLNLPGCLTGSALAGSWNQVLEPGIIPRDSRMRAFSLLDKCPLPLFMVFTITLVVIHETLRGALEKYHIWTNMKQHELSLIFPESGHLKMSAGLHFLWSLYRILPASFSF